MHVVVRSPQSAVICDNVPAGPFFHDLGRREQYWPGVLWKVTACPPTSASDGFYLRTELGLRASGREITKRGASHHTLSARVMSASPAQGGVGQLSAGRVFFPLSRWQSLSWAPPQRGRFRCSSFGRERLHLNITWNSSVQQIVSSLSFLSFFF